MFVYYNNRGPKQSSLDFWQEESLGKGEGEPGILLAKMVLKLAWS